MSSQMPDNYRASDSDRVWVSEMLDAAYADGRLTLQEHEDRIGRALHARTFGELAPLTADLGQGAGLAVPPEAPLPATNPQGHGVRVDTSHQGPADTIVAIFSGSERIGARRVPAATTAVAAFGGVRLDLRDAVLEARTVVVNTWAIFGGIEIIVPEGVRVVTKVAPIFGGATSNVRSSDPNAPTIEVRGLAAFGGVDVKVAGTDDDD